MNINVKIEERKETLKDYFFLFQKSQDVEERVENLVDEQLDMIEFTEMYGEDQGQRISVIMNIPPLDHKIYL